jgi:hypothetical protein
MAIVVTQQIAISAVIVRLDRTIQYAAADAFCSERLRLLDARLRGHDEHPMRHADV